MKFTIAASVILFLTKHTNAQDTCDISGSFSVSSDSCSFDGLVASIKAKLSSLNCPSPNVPKLITSKLGATTLQDVKAEIASACSVAHLPFSFITGQGHVFDKEYFDGGTYYNDQRESTDDYEITINRLATDPGDRIQDIFQNQAQSNGFIWPSDLTNFEGCTLNAAMCCWVQDRQAGDNNGNCATPYDENCVDADPADNTDICYVDMSRAPASSRTSDGFSLFEGEEEGDSHCHGFAWDKDPSDESALFKGNNLFYVSFYDHLQQRGYVRNVPGAPMCGCVEQMAVVTRADCTEISTSETVEFSFNDQNDLSATISDLELEFNACQGKNGKNNDLAAYVERLVDEGRILEKKKEVFYETVVGETYCREAIDSFLDEEGLASKPACRGSYPSECGCEEVNQQDYTGTVSVTRSGRTCQRWDSQSPQSHSRTRRNYPDAYLSENYCRNPDNEPGGAWCYTTDPDMRWEYCDVANCGDTIALGLSERKARQLRGDFSKDK
mmetsp:Transcript_25480/g.37382  ORF Transcript_25480/g.37382 Transcript_25480/m.37382 type:complete len:498 (+) Transcript_25480:37-1530(+)